MRAVGLNWQIERVRREGVRFWWLSFWSEDALRGFRTSVHGSISDGITIRVILDFEDQDVGEIVRLVE